MSRSYIPMAIILPLLSSPALSAQVTDKLEGADDLLLGMGYDTETRKTRATCVEYQKNNIEASSGISYLYYLDLSERYSARGQKMAVSAEFAMRQGFSSLKAKASAETSSKTKTNTVRMTVIAEKIFSWKFVRNVPSGPQTLKLNKLAVDTNDDKGFRIKCGNSWIWGEAKSAKIIGTVEISANSSEDASSIRASISGSYGIYSGRASFQSKINSITKNRRVKVRVSIIGSDTTGQVKSVSEMFSLVDSFLKNLKEDNAKKHAVAIKDYKIFKREVAKIPFLTALDKMAKDKIRFALISNRIDDILKSIEVERNGGRKSRYFIKNKDAASLGKLVQNLKSRQKVIIAAADKLDKAAKKCDYGNDANKSCVYPTDLNTTPGSVGEGVPVKYAGVCEGRAIVRIGSALLRDKGFSFRRLAKSGGGRLPGLPNVFFEIGATDSPNEVINWKGKVGNGLYLVKSGGVPRYVRLAMFLSVRDNANKSVDYRKTIDRRLFDIQKLKPGCKFGPKGIISSVIWGTHENQSVPGRNATLRLYGSRWLKQIDCTVSESPGCTGVTFTNPAIFNLQHVEDNTSD